MGCGKTTAMAFLVDELNRRSEHILPRPKVCYHYCRNDETGTADYIYSVLILSLLQQLPGLKRTFSEWYKNNLKSGTLEPATSTRKLEEFLQEVLGTLDRLLYIVIDGLDECDKQSRRTLLRLLSNLSNSTPRLKILLSSRPEEEILGQLDKSTKIDMESTVFRDAMIVRHMIEERFPDCWTSEIKDLVTNELSRSAHGSSIWTKMIVEFMEIRDYQAIEPIRKFLRNMPLPDKLTNLYRTLISQKSSDDLENQELINMALKVLAISCRSISIQELAWAVALAAALDQVKTVADLAKLVDYGRLMALIAPFITRVDFKDTRKRQVQLVHKSVKEYVILEATTSSTPDESITYDVEILQPFILNICISYLLLDEIGSSPLSSNEQPAMGGLPQGPDLRSGGKPPKEYDPSGTRETSEKDMICYDPTASGFGEFFAYASCHWLVHFSCIESGPPPCLAKIEKLCQAGSTRLHKWTSQDCRPGRKVSGRFHLDSGSHDPLSITSLFGSDALLHKMLKKPTFDEDNYRPSSAINAVDQILQSGDLSKLGIFFLHGKLGHQLRDIEFFRNIIRRWDFAVTPRDNGKAVYELLDHVLDTIVGKHWGGALLCTAASCGCLPIIQHLFNRAQHREELRNDLLCFEAIGEAVPRDDIAVVCYLLNQEGFKASLPYVRNLAGETLLHMASKICDPEMFDLLIPRLKDIIHLVDNDGYTALVRMFRSQTDITWRRRCALILLEHASDSGNNYIGDGKHEPLQEAVKTGNVMMCRALLESEFKFDPFSALKRGNDGQWVLNAEPRVNGDDGQWVLYAEPRANGNELLEMLLEYAIPTSSS
ncbi:hypothetical protein BDV95DRAFT_392286 [Massariosphaeria phaeospora]|uniref:Nephrocystin 3-like N-terminal domain-containing protein n=1 Tax=Massariosphaeria phaeospora TaxID=100035 RepID=A0A7C8MBD5_9PLEO|nr:hypothetical protein BDV95DRAFT_392286 [Massariosphaeria phaeospora]